MDRVRREVVMMLQGILPDDIVHEIVIFSNDKSSPQMKMVFIEINNRGELGRLIRATPGLRTATAARILRRNPPLWELKRDIGGGERTLRYIKMGPRVLLRKTIKDGVY
jgi:hypothetical protein